MKIGKIFGWICLILWIIILVLDIVVCVGGAATAWSTIIAAHVLILFFVARDLAYEYFLYPYLTINLGSIKRKEDNE